MYQYLEKIKELKDDTRGINSVRDLAKLFIEFLSVPEQTANLLAKRDGDLGKLGEELQLGLSSKLSRPVAFEKGKKAILFEITNRVNYYVSLYSYINNESKNLESRIDETYKLISLTNQQDFLQRMASYNHDKLTQDYMLKQLEGVIAERLRVGETDPVDSSSFLQRLYTTISKIGTVSLSEVEQSVIRHTNNYDMIAKEVETYLGAKTQPEVILEEVHVDDVPLLRGERDCIRFIVEQAEAGGNERLPILDSIINLIPNAAKKLYQSVTEYKEYVDQMSKRFDKGGKKFKQWSEMFNQAISDFTTEPVTPDSIHAVINAFSIILKNLVTADSNALLVANKYANIVINHISLYIYVGNLVDLILVSGTIGKGGNNPYAEKQKRKEAIVDKLGELNTVGELKAEGKPTPPTEPAKGDDGQIETAEA